MLHRRTRRSATRFPRGLNHHRSPKFIWATIWPATASASTSSLPRPPSVLPCPTRWRPSGAKPAWKSPSGKGQGPDVPGHVEKTDQWLPTLILIVDCEGSRVRARARKLRGWCISLSRPVVASHSDRKFEEGKEWRSRPVSTSHRSTRSGSRVTRTRPDGSNRP